MDSPVSEGAVTTLNDLGVVLNDVNKIRLALGIGQGTLPNLPAGIPGNASQCVLAKALSNGWEAEVDCQITLTHPLDFDTSFDWAKAQKVLIDMGFDAYLSSDYEYESDRYITITATPEMAQLIIDFDNKLIPDLILND